MDRPCRIAIKCPGPAPGLEADSPVTNYSSEYTDGVNFDGWRFPKVNPYDPFVPGWWSSDACDGAFHCISYVSQEEADDCAAALAFNCVHTPPQPPTTPEICVINPPACAPVGPELFPNQTQSASFVCPDGSIFTWTINSGTVYSTSTAQANAVALAMAQFRVARYFICLPALPSQPCDGVFYSVSLDISGNNGPYSVDIIAGDLPPGISPVMVDFNTFGFQGIPAGTGDYVFTVRVTASTGTTVDKTYSMSVMGFTNATVLTEANEGAAYTETLVGIGGTAPHTFAITEGTLPTGLTMNTAGQITGTPDPGTEGDYLFTVAVTDTAGRTCSKEFSLKVAVGCWVDLASPLFVETLITINGTGSATDGISSDAIVQLDRVLYPQTFNYDLLNPDGSGYGSGSIDLLWYYHALDGGDTNIGPGNFLDQVNMYGTSDTGSVGMIYNSGATLKIEFWNPSLGSLMSITSNFVSLDNYCVGPDDHFVHGVFDGGANWDIWIWHSGVDTHMLGSTHQGLTHQCVASTGHAVFAIRVGTAYYKAWFWDGITISEIYDPGINVTKVFVNASDLVAGLVTNSSFFTWDPINGLTVIGLPPGAATGSNIWVTDSGLIVANANNGSWYYKDGVWARLHLLLDPAEGWTNVSSIRVVSHDGHAAGVGTQGATPNQHFWCKFCEPA